GPVEALILSLIGPHGGRTNTTRKPGSQFLIRGITAAIWHFTQNPMTAATPRRPEGPARIPPSSACESITSATSASAPPCRPIFSRSEPFSTQLEQLHNPATP